MAFSITSFTPTTAKLDGVTVITVTGTGFLGESILGASLYNDLTSGSTVVSFTVVNDSTITFVMPTECLYKSALIHIYGNVSLDVFSSGTFTIIMPNTTGISPTSGKAGFTSVTVIGTSLNSTYGNSATISFGTSDIYIGAVSSSTSITMTVPITAASGTVYVHDGFGSGSGGIAFTVLAPNITSVSPSSGPPGTSIIITGTNLANNTREISLSASSLQSRTPIAFTVVSDTQITCLIPNIIPKAYSIIATNAGSLTGTSAVFTITANTGSMFMFFV